MRRPAMSPEDLGQFFVDSFPQAVRLGFEVVATSFDAAEIALDAHEEHLRPGGIVSGPTLMTLVDTAMYAALLARIGPEAAPCVTTSIEVHFLARVVPGRVKARGRLLRVGRRLAVGAVEIEGPDGALGAHATVTYALPDGVRDAG